MPTDDSRDLRERVEAATHRVVRRPIEIIDNAQSYTDIQPGMVLRLEAGDYYIQGEATEGRFGIDDQPKLWVKYAFDLADGARKIVKLPFLEQFETRIGPITVRCVRDPDKESRVLEEMAGDHRFMHGLTVRDRLGNNIRIIDLIRGRSLYALIADLDLSHERYFREVMPGVLRGVLDCVEGLVQLHARDLQHGDVRTDHIFVETDTGRYRWIDFDYQANFRDYDIYGLGAVLAYVVGGGSFSCQEARRLLGREDACVEEGDALMLARHRLVNLQKLFPYIPDQLNEVLMAFSESAEDFYESAQAVVEDLRAVIGIV